MDSNNPSTDEKEESIDSETVTSSAGNLSGEPQVWVPTEVKAALGIEIGDQVSFTLRDDAAIMERGEKNALGYDPDEFGEMDDIDPVPTATVETRKAAIAGGRTETEAVVRFDLPPAVVEEIEEKHGELDKDAVSDRISVVPYVDDEPV